MLPVIPDKRGTTLNKGRQGLGRVPTSVYCVPLNARFHAGWGTEEGRGAVFLAFKDSAVELTQPFLCRTGSMGEKL